MYEVWVWDAVAEDEVKVAANIPSPEVAEVVASYYRQSGYPARTSVAA